MQKRIRWKQIIVQINQLLTFSVNLEKDAGSSRRNFLLMGNKQKRAMAKISYCLPIRFKETEAEELAGKSFKA